MQSENQLNSIYRRLLFKQNVLGIVDYLRKNSCSFANFESFYASFEISKSDESLQDSVLILAKALRGATILEPYDINKITEYMISLDNFIELNQIPER